MSVIDNTFESFLWLVRRGIGHQHSIPNDSFNWGVIEKIASQQGLQAVILDGLDGLETRPPQDVLLNWIGDVLQNYEQRYVVYEVATGTLAGFYNQNGFKMMVLKGYACSLDWPKPNHRPCGDIDIWQFGQWREADAAMAKEKGIKIDKGHHHHTVFEWKGFTVENHYDFVNVYAHRSSKELESIFKELGQDDSHFVEVNGEKVYLPSANLHALFLMRHLANHFVSAEINLRQVLDWAFFVEKHTKEIDWNWLIDVLKEYHMYDFYNIINAICVGDLGFDVRIFPNVQFVPVMKDKVLADILCPAFDSEMPKGFVRRMEFKFRRWKSSEWKHNFVYKESMWSAFWSGVWGHLLKPSSI